MKLPIKLLSHLGAVPHRGSEHAAGYDLRSAETLTIHYGETAMVKTDIAVAIPPGHFGMIASRSGLGRRGIVVAQGVGIVDADYRNAISVLLHNRSGGDFNVFVGDRIAQLVLVPFVEMEFEGVGKLDDTARGQGGFGSTGD